MARVSLCEIHPAAYERPASGGVIDGGVYVTTNVLEVTRVFVIRMSTRPQQRQKTLIKMLLFRCHQGKRGGGGGGGKGSDVRAKQKRQNVRILRGNRPTPVLQIRFSAPSAGCHGAYCDLCVPSEVSRARSREGGRIVRWRSHRHYHRRWLWAGVPWMGNGSGRAVYCLRPTRPIRTRTGQRRAGVLVRDPLGPLERLRTQRK